MIKQNNILFKEISKSKVSYSIGTETKAQLKTLKSRSK